MVVLMIKVQIGRKARDKAQLGQVKAHCAWTAMDQSR
jgi:hypothetical protein